MYVSHIRIVGMVQCNMLIKENLEQFVLVQVNAIYLVYTLHLLTMISY